MGDNGNIGNGQVISGKNQNTPLPSLSTINPDKGEASGTDKCIGNILVTMGLSNKNKIRLIRVNKNSKFTEFVTDGLCIKKNTF